MTATTSQTYVKPREGHPLLAAIVAFVIVFFVMTWATILSAPTKGAPITDFSRYMREAMATAPAFIYSGMGLGVLLGAAFATMTYRVWGVRHKRQDFIAAYIFLAPYLFVTLIFTIGVLIFAFYIAFHRYDIFTDPVFVGLKNFEKAFKSKDFLRSLVNVFWYSLLVTVIQTTFALLLAVFLNQKIRGRNFFRTVFYTPSVTSSVVISLIFWWLYLKTGYLNWFFDQVWSWFGAEWKAVNWLNDPRGLFQLIARAFGGDIPSKYWYLRGPSVTWMAIMFQNIFTTIPTFMIMFLAGLQDIPQSLYEAADIDGANDWHKLRHVTIPMLRPIILLVVVLGTIGTLQIFDQVKILTSGGPLGTTLTPVYIVYTEALGTQGPIQMGYASALAFILFVIIFVFTFLQRRYIERETEMY